MWVNTFVSSLAGQQNTWRQECGLKLHLGRNVALQTVPEVVIKLYCGKRMLHLFISE